MRRRYELSTLKLERIAPLLPDRTHKGGSGHPWRPHRRLINGILWVLHTGAPWRDVPQRYGPWQTVYDRFNRWRADGTWANILTHVLDRFDKPCVAFTYDKSEVPKEQEEGKRRCFPKYAADFYWRPSETGSARADTEIMPTFVSKPCLGG